MGCRPASYGMPLHSSVFRFLPFLVFHEQEHRDLSVETPGFQTKTAVHSSELNPLEDQTRELEKQSRSFAQIPDFLACAVEAVAPLALVDPEHGGSSVDA